MSVAATCSTTDSMENVSNNLGRMEGAESDERKIGTTIGQDEKNYSNYYYTATDMLNTMNRAMKEFTCSGQDDIRSDPMVELHQRMPDGSTIPVDTSTRKATDTQMKLKQVSKIIHCQEETYFIFLKKSTTFKLNLRNEPHHFILFHSEKHRLQIFYPALPRRRN